MINALVQFARIEDSTEHKWVKSSDCAMLFHLLSPHLD